MAADRFGRVHIVWQGPDFFIWYAQVGADGLVKIPATKVYADVKAGIPRIAVDDAGDAHVVFGLTGLSYTGVLYIKVSGGNRVLTGAFQMFPPNTIFEHEQDSWPSIAINPVTQLPVIAADVTTSYTVQFGFPFPIPVTVWNEYVRTVSLDAAGKPVSYATPYSLDRIPSPQYRAQYSSVAVDSLGTTHVVWVHRDPDWAGFSVGYAKEGATTWTEIANSRNVPGLSGRPRIIAGEGSSVDVVWATTEGATIWQELDHFGLTSVDDTVVSGPAAKGRWPGIAAGFGNLVCAWTDARVATNSQILFRSLRDDLPEADVSQSPTSAANSVVALPSTNRVAFAWQDNRSGSSQVYYRELAVAPVPETNQVVGNVRRFVPAGAPLEGVTVSLSSGALNKTVRTTADGFFTFQDVPRGTYTITPAKVGYEFDPTNRVVAVRGTTDVPALIAKQVVELVAIEVNQSVQNWSNTVPLIEGKKTLVRAFLQLPAGVEAGTPGIVRNIRLRMGGDTFSPLLAGGQGPFEFKAEIASVRDRGEWDSSINFVLNPDDVVSNPTTLALEWDDGVLRTVTLFPFGELPQVSVPVEKQSFTAVYRFIPLTASDPVLGLFEPDSQAVETLARRLVAMYPIVAPWHPSGSTKVHRDSYPWIVPFVPILGPDHDVVNQLRSRVHVLNATPQSDVEYSFEQITLADAKQIATRRYGTTIPITYGSSLPALGVANGLFTDASFERGKSIHTHEIGHLLRRPHTAGRQGGIEMMDPNKKATWIRRGPNGEAAPFLAGELDNDLLDDGYLVYTGDPTTGETHISPSLDQKDYSTVYGWDSSQAKGGDYHGDIIRPATAELMSYGSQFRWVSDYNYKRLLASLKKRFGSTVRRLALANSANSFLVTGSIDLQNESATLDPIVALNAADSDPVGDGDAEFVLVAISAGGAEAERTPIAVVTGVPESPDDEVTNRGWFKAFIPYDAAIRRIELRKGTKVLAAVSASASAPVVELLHPKGGEVLAGTTADISWQVSDQDSPRTYSTLQFSADGGTQWQTLSMDGESQALTVDLSHLPGTTNGVFRVLVSDGFNSASAVTAGPITIGNKPPTVEINSPSGGQSFVGEQSVVLEAFAGDLEDGFPGGTNVVWISNRDGVVGTGGFVVKKLGDFSEGVHELRAVVHDSAGATNAASVTIRIAVAPPPALAVEAVGDRLFISWDTSDSGYRLEFASSVQLGWEPVSGDLTRFHDRLGMFVRQDVGQRFFRLKKEDGQ